MSGRRRLRTFGWPASTALALALLAPAPAAAETERATHGTVTAELSYNDKRRGELDRRTPFDVSPLGREYLRALKRFLRRTGYLG